MPIEFTVANTNISPPGGFVYTFPETGFTASHFDYNAFKKQYESHALGNKIYLEPDWEAVLLDKMCRENAKKWGTSCKRVAKRGPINPLNFGTLMSFLTVMGLWAKNTLGGADALVPMEEAESRAAICATCPYRMTISTGCGSCQAAVTAGVEKLIGQRVTSYDTQLKDHACGLCGCALKAAILLPLAPQQAGLSESVKERFKEATWCWKAKGL